MEPELKSKRVREYLSQTLPGIGVSIERELLDEMCIELCRIPFVLDDQISSTGKVSITGPMEPQSKIEERRPKFNRKDLERSLQLISWCDEFSDEFKFIAENEIGLLLASIEKTPIEEEQLAYVHSMLQSNHLNLPPSYFVELSQKMRDFCDGKLSLSLEKISDPDKLDTRGYKPYKSTGPRIHTELLRSLAGLMIGAMESAAVSSKYKKAADWLNGFFKARNGIEVDFSDRYIKAVILESVEPPVAVKLQLQKTAKALGQVIRT